ncbi:MAG: hypothetical protein ACRC0V_05215, partial [Fusobacteriaceae bacterium]
MKLNNDVLIKEFYERVKDKYSKVLKDQYRDVCFYPWIFLKEQMSNGLLENIRFKYFGEFKVYKRRTEEYLNNLEKSYDKGEITEKHFKIVKEKLL